MICLVYESQKKHLNYLLPQYSFYIFPENKDNIHFTC